MNKKADADLFLIGLPEGESPDQVGEPDSGTSLYAKELAAYSQFDDQDDEAYERRVRHAFLARELRQIDDIVASRKSYANKIFLLVVGWLVVLGVIVLLAGWRPGDFQLDTKVLLALIGGTTLNVLGIFTIVTNFLFPRNGHSIFSRGKGAADVRPTRQPGGRKRPPTSKAEPQHGTTGPQS